MSKSGYKGTFVQKNSLFFDRLFRSIQGKVTGERSEYDWFEKNDAGEITNSGTSSDSSSSNVTNSTTWSTDTKWDSINNGYHWTLNDGNTIAWYPAMGGRSWDNGSLGDVGLYGYYWSATSDDDRKAAYDRAEDELGDFLFATVNAARLYGLNPDTALERTCAKFRRRFTYLEEQTIRKGRNLKDMTLAEMDAIWDEGKAKGL